MVRQLNAMRNLSNQFVVLKIKKYLHTWFHFEANFVVCDTVQYSRDLREIFLDCLRDASSQCKFKKSKAIEHTLTRLK